jgi:hypothetical protein
MQAIDSRAQLVKAVSPNRRATIGSIFERTALCSLRRNESRKCQRRRVLPPSDGWRTPRFVLISVRSAQRGLAYTRPEILSSCRLGRGDQSLCRSDTSGLRETAPSAHHYRPWLSGHPANHAGQWACPYRLEGHALASQRMLAVSGG